MKVNIYDPENIQKGRMMLLNIAEDLKSDCKVVVSPQKDERSTHSVQGEKKPRTPDQMEAAAKKSKQRKDEFVALDVDEDEFEDDYDNQPEYVYMELKSTASFKDIDIDAMLEHTTFDEFMKDLYLNRIAAQKTTTKGDKPTTDFENMWQNFMVGGNEIQKQDDLRLAFDDDKDKEDKKGLGDSLMEQKALANVRERRKRLAQSAIFDGSEKKKTQAQIDAELEAQSKNLDNQIDLT